MKNTLAVNWQNLYIGLQKDWLSPEKVVSYIVSNNLINEISNDEAGDLFIHEQDKDFLINFMTKKIQGDYNQFIAIRDWISYYLISVYTSNESISEKLVTISMIWAMFDYPEDWNNFIYYLPIIEGEEGSPEKVYRNFVRFIKNNFIK